MGTSPFSGTVAVVGLGLMGGSLGMALKRRTGVTVLGVARRAVSLKQAFDQGVFDEGFLDPAMALARADVVVFCVPVDRVIPLAKSLKKLYKPGALVTDVGSVKGPIARDAQRVFLGDDNVVFVGGHPMTGSEKTGLGFARADLYDGTVCVVSPSGGTPLARVVQAERFWSTTGAEILRLDPKTHDRTVALVSHLPHLLADALVLTAGQVAKTPKQRALLRRVAAGSFRDATRVAGADPALWHAIFSMNDRSVRSTLGKFQQQLSLLAKNRWALKDLRRAQNLQPIFRKDKT